MAYARLLTRNTSGLHPNLRGLGFLGDSPGLTPSAALQQAIQLYSGKHLNEAQFQDQTWLQDAENAIQTAQIPVTGGFGPQCSGIAAQPVNLFQTASGLALGTTSAGIGILASTTVIAATTAAIAGAITMGVGVIIAVIDLIFAHHAAAVKRDLNFGCSVWPAVNNAFALIAQAVQNGTMTPANAAAALPEIYSQVMSAGGASGTVSGPGNIPSGGTSINDSPYCNSNCELSVVLLGMVFFWQANYQALAAEQQAGEQAAAASATAPLTQSALSIATPTPTTALSISTPATTSPAVPVSQATSLLPTLTPATAATPASAPSSGLAAIPAWGWLALAALGAWAVL
jgi:hypothetical protein